MSFTFAATTKPDECALITELVARRIAYPLALLANRLGFTANLITLIGGGCWIASAPTMVLGAHFIHSGRTLIGWSFMLTTVLLWNAGYVLDLVDGSVARMTNTATPSGFYLDYVFHLFCKPMFLSSIGFAAYLLHDQPLLLVLAVLSIAANWSASASAVQHVICQLQGKEKVRLPAPLDDRAKTLLLGATDIQETVEQKRKSVARLAITIAKEMLSYYGQFPFFGALLLVDFFTRNLQEDKLYVTTITFVVLSCALILRIPLRMRREFIRAKLLDD